MSEIIEIKVIADTSKANDGITLNIHYKISPIFLVESINRKIYTTSGTILPAIK